MSAKKAEVAVDTYEVPNEETILNTPITEASAEEMAETDNDAKTVPLSTVWADDARNVRGPDDSEAAKKEYAALLASVLAHRRILQSVIVVEDKKGAPKGALYRVIAGYRRFAAAKEAGLTKILISVETLTNGIGRLDGTTGKMMRVQASPLAVETSIATAENTIRADISAWDTIALVNRYVREGMSREDVNTALGAKALAQSTFYNYRKIGSMPPSVFSLCRSFGAVGNKVAHKLIGEKSVQIGGRGKTLVWNEEKALAKAKKWCENPDLLKPAPKEEQGNGEEGGGEGENEDEGGIRWEAKAPVVAGRLQAIRDVSEDAYFALAVVLGQIGAEDMDEDEQALFRAIRG